MLMFLAHPGYGPEAWRIPKMGPVVGFSGTADDSTQHVKLGHSGRGSSSTFGGESALSCGMRSGRIVHHSRR